MSARGRRIRVWPRRSTSRPAIGAPDRGRDEVRARDRAGRRVAAAVLAHEEQQRQSDHPHRQPRK